VVVGVSPLVFVGVDESGESTSPAGGGEPVLSDPKAASVVLVDSEVVLVDAELVGG
jgi:hypothetical protein